MSPKSEEGRSAEPPSRSAGKATDPARGEGAVKLTPRPGLYMITCPGAAAKELSERLKRTDGIEVVRTIPAQAKGGEPVVVAGMVANVAAALRNAPGPALIIEPDHSLIAATWSMADPAVTTTVGPGFTTTIQVVGAKDEPVARAEVHLLGRSWAAQGITGADGKVQLTLFGESPDSVSALLVKPRTGYWSLWTEAPAVDADAVQQVTLRPLPADAPGWGAKAMQFDQLPARCRGKGVKIALIDTGAAVSHRQLAKLSQGMDVAGGSAKAWAQDPAGHGTLSAGIVAAWSEDGGPPGYAPEAETHICRVPPDGRCSDLVVALDYCLDAGIDVVDLGFCCRHGSMIVERRIELAKRMGMAVVAPAGNGGDSVQFPASSPHVLAVGAIGKHGAAPLDSPHADGAAAAILSDGYFSPAFSSAGPEVDVCAPAVAVLCCQSPDGYAAVDGTSVAAAHVAALAALVLAHHPDFRQAFAGRNSQRVERLFQIIKETAQPVALDARRVGAGVPDAARALGLTVPANAPAGRAGKDTQGSLEAMRAAFQLAGLTPSAPGRVARGPAMVSRAPLTPAGFAPGATASLAELRAAMAEAGLRPLH